MSDDRPVVAETVGDETVVAWPLIFRERFSRTIGGERSRWVVLWTVLAGLFATGFSITILAVSLGTVARDLGTDTTLLTWTVTGPLKATDKLAKQLREDGVPKVEDGKATAATFASSVKSLRASYAEAKTAAQALSTDDAAAFSIAVQGIAAGLRRATR
jgi:hypothetical protein